MRRHKLGFPFFTEKKHSQNRLNPRTRDLFSVSKEIVSETNDELSVTVLNNCLNAVLAYNVL